MKSKWPTFAILLLLAANLIWQCPRKAGAQTVNARDIERVRNKSVLDSEDLQVIDDFVGQTVAQLLKTKDFSCIAKVRSMILAYSQGKGPSQAQYEQQFSDSAYRHISLALKQAHQLAQNEGQLTPESKAAKGGCPRKFKVILNLLILIDALLPNFATRLGDLRLAELALEQLKDKTPEAVHYWAVHCVTNPAIIEQLNSSKKANLQLAERIIKNLEQLIERASPETLALMAKFAGQLNNTQAQQLLIQIADARIKKYANWTVDYELLDATILKLLCDKLTSPSKTSPGFSQSVNPVIACRFGQLYSYAIQRYVKGRNFLNAHQKHQLASVLVEVERACIGKLLSVHQFAIKKAIEHDDYIGLLSEHNRLLGDETTPGKLVLKLNFDYGTNPDGSKRTAPLALPAPPRERISY